MRALWTLAAGVALSPGAALACALELILAVDVSGSINREEFALQTEGMAVPISATPSTLCSSNLRRTRYSRCRS